MTASRSYSIFLLAMSLLAVALAFRLFADGIERLGSDPSTDRTAIPTVYLQPADPGMSRLNPQPHLLRAT